MLSPERVIPALHITTLDSALWSSPCFPSTLNRKRGHYYTTLNSGTECLHSFPKALILSTKENRFSSKRALWIDRKHSHFCLYRKKKKNPQHKKRGGGLEQQIVVELHPQGDHVKTKGFSRGLCYDKLTSQLCICSCTDNFDEQKLK